MKCVAIGVLALTVMTAGCRSGSPPLHESSLTPPSTNDQLVSLQEKFNIPLDEAKCLLEQTESGLSPNAAYTACVEVPKAEQHERDLDAQKAAVG